MEQKAELLIAGVMSGTSADGVDVALVRIECDSAGDQLSKVQSIHAELLHHQTYPYASELRSSIFTLRAPESFTWRQIAGTGRRITLAHAAAVTDCLRSAGRSASDFHAIADHGQTFFHDPPDTIQWLDPALLAAAVGCPVISDFRRADCAAGGQGAPLVPFADYVLFRHAVRARVLLNIGGIANLTSLPANATIDDVVAFDTGPGNCISDHLVSQSSSDAGSFDAGGALAARGQPIPGWVDRLLLHPYFIQPPPKSTDRPETIRFFEETVRAFAPRASLESKLYACCELTARSIADSIQKFVKIPPDELFASGGGVENATLMRLLKERLPGVNVRRTDELGIPSQAKEAVAFALLGAATLWGLPSNVPSATGAKRPVVLGNITPRPTT